MNKKILIIEDNPATVSMLETLLKFANYQVSIAYDGPSGIKVAQAERPDLILLDIMMPEMDGIEVCKRLRQESQFGKIPIIILSAKAGEANIKEGMDAGATDYLVKPFDLDKMLLTVKNYLANVQ